MNKLPEEVSEKDLQILQQKFKLTDEQMELFKLVHKSVIELLNKAGEHK